MPGVLELPFSDFIPRIKAAIPNPIPAMARMLGRKSNIRPAMPRIIESLPNFRCLSVVFSLGDLLICFCAIFQVNRCKTDYRLPVAFSHSLMVIFAGVLAGAGTIWLGTGKVVIANAGCSSVPIVSRASNNIDFISFGLYQI